MARHENFVLVEPLLMQDVADRPNLGCASLMGALKGFPARLVPGQTRYIADFFLDWDEIVSYAKAFKPNCPTSHPAQLKQVLDQKGPAQVKNDFSDLYKSLIVEKELKTFLKGEKIQQFLFFYQAIMELYDNQITVYRNYRIGLINRYIDNILSLDPAIIGFSLHSYDAVSITNIIIRKIKETTSLPIILGGSFLSKLSPSGAELLLKQTGADYLVVHEGEVALPLLLESIRQKSIPQGPNIVCFRNGLLHKTPEQPITDLNALPEPDFSQFPLDKYLIPEIVLPVQTSRGCSWQKCTFCSHKSLYKEEYKTYSPARVKEIVERLSERYKCRHFIFHDEEITPEHALAVAEALQELPGRYFSDYARPTSGFTPLIFRKMHQAGFRMLQWGIESGSQAIINSMRKGTKVETMQKVLRASHRAGIYNLCWIILGFPGEDSHTLTKTLQFLERNHMFIDDILTDNFILEHGSLIHRNPHFWDLEIDEKGGNPLSSIIPFTMKNRPSPEIEKVLSRLRFQPNRYSSSTLRCLTKNNLKRLQRFLVAAHDPVFDFSPPADGDWFPLAFPEIVEDKGKFHFIPYRYPDTDLNNSIRSKKKQSLNEFEREALFSCNGRLSIEQIEKELKQKSGINLVQWLEKLAEEKMVLFFKKKF